MPCSLEYETKYCDLDCPVQKKEIAHCSKTGTVLVFMGNEYFGRVDGCKSPEPEILQEIEVAEVAKIVEVVEVKKEEPLTLF